MYIRIVGCPRYNRGSLRLVIADQGGQKNRNGKMNAFFFRHVFFYYTK